MKKFLGICFVICLVFVSSAEAQKKAKFTTSGYFSGMELSCPTCDLAGMSVYLTESDGTMYALVTIAEGVERPPVLVEAAVSGQAVEFSLPRNEDSGIERKFKGTVSAEGLKLETDEGEFGENGEMLKRECRKNNTFSNITVGKESGDYGGIEIFVTSSDGDWYALVTVAEGVMLPPRLIEAKVTGKNFDKIEFTLPNDNGGRKFTGTISQKSKTLTLNESGSRSVLKAKCRQ